MKKLFIFILLLLCMVSLSASVIEADGYGKSIDKAKEDAMKNLTSLIMGENVLAITETKLSTAGDNYIEKSYTSESSSLSYGSLFGVSYTDPVTIKNNYKVTAYIDESQRNGYMNKLVTLSTDINNLYSNKDGFSDDMNSFYVELMVMLHDYEAYSYVVCSLGAAYDDVPVLNQNITFNSIKLDYNSFLIENEEKIEKMMNNADKDSDAYDEMMQDLLNIRKAQRDNLENNKKERIEALQKQDLRVKQIIESMTSKGLGLKKNIVSDNVGAYLADLEDTNKRLYEIIRERDDLIKSESSRIDKMSKAECDALMNTPYRIAEKDKFGNPLPEEVALRNKKVAEIKDHYEEQKNSLIAEINSSLNVEIREYQKLLKSKVQTLTKQTFHITLDDIMKTSNGKATIVYDGVSCSWIVDILGKISSCPVNFEVILPYNKVTGDKVPDSKDEEYKAKVDAYDSLLKNGSYSAVLSYKLRETDGNGFLLDITKAEITSLKSKFEVSSIRLKQPCIFKLNFANQSHIEKDFKETKNSDIFPKRKKALNIYWNVEVGAGVACIDNADNDIFAAVVKADTALGFTVADGMCALSLVPEIIYYPKYSYVDLNFGLDASVNLNPFIISGSMLVKADPFVFDLGLEIKYVFKSFMSIGAGVNCSIPGAVSVYVVVGANNLCTK